MNDKGWQELVNQFGIDVALQVLLNEFHKHESLEQPSPKINVPTIASDSSSPVGHVREGEDGH